MENRLDDRVRPRWSNSGLLTRLLTLVVFAASERLALAQNEITPREADQELNSSYQEAIRGLTPAAREKLKKAQRAWLVFVEKNSAAMRIAAQPLGIPPARCQEVEVKEVVLRSRDFFSSKESNAGETFKVHFQRVDADLNAVYQRCLALLSPAGQAEAALVDCVPTLPRLVVSRGPSRVTRGAKGLDRISRCKRRLRPGVPRWSDSATR